MPPNGSDRVSVSLDTLRVEIRAANGELELSLRKYIADELDKKAGADVVTALVQTVSDLQREILSDEERRMVRALGRGEFSRAQSAAIADMFDERTRERSDAGWTKRERIMAVAGAVFTILSIALSVLALSGVKG